MAIPQAEQGTASRRTGVFDRVASLPANRVLQVVDSEAASGLAVVIPLMDALRREGLTVEAACPEGALARDLAGRGYVVHTCEAHERPGLRNATRSFWALRRLLARERFDIVHIHAPSMAAAGRLAARLAGTPVVIYTAYGSRLHGGARWTAWTEKALGRITHLLFTQSAEDAQLAINERIRPPQHVVWISNGVDLGRFSPAEDPAEARRAFGIASEERVIGFAGRLCREKGALELVEAVTTVARSVPGVVLLVAEDRPPTARGEDALSQTVREYLRRSGLRFRAVFTPDGASRETMMRAIDVLAVPSHREGLPGSVIEAMATARPVVATDISGCREQVVNGETGLLVPAGDADAFASALREVLTDPRTASEMGRRGRLRAEAHFDEREVVGRQLAAYRRMVRQKLPATAASVAASRQDRRSNSL